MRRVSSAHLKINMDIRSDVEVRRNDEDKAIPPVVNRGCEIESAKSKKKSIKAVMNMEFACDKNIKRGDQIWNCHTCRSVYHHDSIIRVALATARELI